MGNKIFLYSRQSLVRSASELVALSLLFFAISCAAHRTRSSTDTGLNDNGGNGTGTNGSNGNRHERTRSKNGAVADARKYAPEPVPAPDKTVEDEDKSSYAKTPAEIESLTIGEVIRIEEPNSQNLYDDSRYDFPITMNSRVEGWIDYFTGRGRSHMERYLARSSRYIPLMRAILKKNGLPEDLVYLALIESGFNLRAKSRARAVGPWQFIAETGRRYGLSVNAWVDERRDVVHSTEAAARYLKDLYLMFESWYLAASAYNAGETKILRAIEELRTNNYWRICETGFLRRETRDYIPKLISAAIIAKNPDRYGFDDIEYQEPLSFETVVIDFPVQLKEVAQVTNVSNETIEDLNPELRRNMVPPSMEYEIKVPVGTKMLVEAAMSSLRARHPSVEIPKQITVKAGDTLSTIARRYKVTIRDLANTNNISPKERLTPGAVLLLPQAVASSPRREVVTSERKAASTEQYIKHVVKKGESLWSIAIKYNVTVQALFRWNNLRRSRIQAGRVLRVRLG